MTTTADSPLLAPPSASPQQAETYIVGRGSVYTPHDIGVIVGHYWRPAAAVGLDPLLAMAQRIHRPVEARAALRIMGRGGPGPYWTTAGICAHRCQGDPGPARLDCQGAGSAAAAGPLSRGGSDTAGLNGRWAVPGTDYGQRITKLANEIRAVPA